MRRFAMLIRRELWEHRSLWMTPLIISAVMLLVIGIVGRISLPGLAAPQGAPAISLPGADRSSVWSSLLFALSTLYFLAAAILMIVYLLDCLYAERRDRSVLFWRSLPVSDTQTVLAKLFTGLVVIPLLGYLALSLTALLGMLLLKLRVGSDSIFAAYFALRPLQALRAEFVLLAAMMLSVLWYAPYAAYLLMVSSWARRSIFAWAFVPPLLLALAEKLTLGTSYFGNVVLRGFREFAGVITRISFQLDMTIGNFFPGWPGRGPGGGHRPEGDLGAIFASPQLWIGLLVAAALVWVAVWRRRRSEDS